MDIISLQELQEKMDRHDDLKLVMTLGELAFQGKHIPGSINIYSKAEMLEQLDPQDEIVVYCSDQMCPASIMAYHLLIEHGYKNVRRFSGGLAEWEDAGLPLEGELVNSGE
jgi:rhodanese-related sulfurtransferase